MISPPPITMKDMHLLKAGVFSVGYQNGFIRHIHYGEIEVVRSIYMALRDQNWFTYEHTIENESIEEYDDHFEIQYDCFHQLNGQRIFTWHVQIKGTSGSVITFEVDGEALTDVLKNRAGICVLHPLKYTAGYPCELLQTDGSQIKKVFPVTISAENPFKDLRAFRWRCHYDWYILNFEGDVFETEDQRNWSDASYKTFCTPLSRPFPVLLPKGEKVHQKVSFRPESELFSIPKKIENLTEINALDKKSTLPAIGLCASTETDDLTPEVLELLQALNLNHYRIDVQPSSAKWVQKFSADCAQAKQLNLPVDIALYIADINELAIFNAAVGQLNPQIERILLLTADRPATAQSLIDEVDTLRKRFPSVQVGAGTDQNFRELNCNRFDASRLDFVSYGIDPQEHATDDLTIIENIGAQSDAVQSVRDIFGETKAVHISSLTLRKRSNPAATNSKDKFLSNDQRTDPRQPTPFTAAFTLGSIKTLAQAEATSINFYQTAGNQGILSKEGFKYPVYDVFREVLSGGKQIIHTTSSQPLLADGLLLQGASELKLILVNYTSSEQNVVFRKDFYTLKPHEIKVIQVN